MDDTKTPVPAMPHLDELFTPGRLDELIVVLFGLARNYFDRSLTVTENVTRIPVKVGEQQLPGTAADGLRYFTPVDIYDHNVACTEGLVQVFKILQDLEGFGMTRHLRSTLLLSSC